MATLTVGSGQQYGTIAKAIAASQDGDVLKVQAGTYVNDFSGITKDITLEAVGGRVHMKAAASPQNGKAILIINADVTIKGFEFSGTKVPDGNGAGIRHSGGDLTILDSHFHHNQTGILTNAKALDATLTIRDSEFDHNGIGDGRTHNIYVGKIGRLEVDNSYFHDVPVGHLLKSRALETVITDSRFFSQGSTASYEIDLPNGGRAELRDNVIQQGPNSQNQIIIAFGAEGGLHADSSIEMTGNTVINMRQGGGPLLWNKAGAPAEVTNTEVYGLDASNLLWGPATVTGTTFLKAPPKLDISSPWQGGGKPPGPDPETPTPPPVERPPEEPPEEPPTEPGGDPLRKMGTSADDHLVGGDGDDALFGRTGDDLLQGGAGRDALDGATGDDTLDGGTGDDVLMGGLGADVYVFGPDFGNDRVRGFDHGSDMLDISALGIAERDFAALVDITQQGPAVVITVADEGTITFLGGDATKFDRADFILG
jgi:hypothetical protein